MFLESLCLFSSRCQLRLFPRLLADSRPGMHRDRFARTNAPLERDVVRPCCAVSLPTYKPSRYAALRVASMPRDSEVAAARGLTDVLALSFIDLAPCTACVANVSDAATITTEYAPRAFVKALFIIGLPSVFCRSSAIYFSNYSVIDERVAFCVVAPIPRFTFLTQSLRALYESCLAAHCRMEMQLGTARSRYGF